VATGAINSILNQGNSGGGFFNQSSVNPGVLGETIPINSHI
jgi:hypothetical protein